MKKIAILTGGGDCPGLNAVIRGVVKTAIEKYNLEVLGFIDGYRGLVENRTRTLTLKDVEDILDKGGTILGSSNKENPFAYIDKPGDTPVDLSDRCVEQMKADGIDALVVIGGDGTLTSGRDFSRKGFNVVGVPKTIDNDLCSTDITFGFNTAIATATEAIDKIKTTAASHHRAMVVEIMGRYAGWLTLSSGIAGGADVIIIPEIEYNIDKVCEVVKKNEAEGKRYSIIAISEGAKPKGGEITIAKIIEDSAESIRLGGVANKVAEQIENMTGVETRATILGHIQRGGQTSPYDRILSTRYGVKAVELLLEGKYGNMVALHGDKVEYVPLEEAIGKQKVVPVDHELVKTAKSMGICFGD